MSIGDGAALDDVDIGGFSLDGGEMLLAPLKLGTCVTVPCKVSLVPGICVPDHTAFNPLSSSWEMPPSGPGYDRAAEANRRACAATFPTPVWYLRLLGLAIIWGVWALEQLPVLVVLKLMVASPWYMPLLETYQDVLLWFLAPQRVLYYVCLRLVRQILLPPLRLALCLLVKWSVIGRFEPGKRTRSKWNCFRSISLKLLSPFPDLDATPWLTSRHGLGQALAHGGAAPCPQAAASRSLSRCPL